MNALARLQREFQGHLLLSGHDDFAVRSVVSTPAADAAKRVGIYTFGYSARLLEILSNDFLGLRAMAGDEIFETLAHAYIEATPSKHYNARWYGQHFAQFIAQVGPDRPEFAEMATLEWAMGTSFDAPDEPHVDSSLLESLSPEQWPVLRLRLHNSVQMLRMQFNTGALRRAADHDETMPPIQRLASPERWVVSRRDNAVRYREAAADECAALETFADGACLIDVCEALCEWLPEDEVAMRAASLLKQWTYDQWVASVSFDADDR